MVNYYKKDDSISISTSNMSPELITYLKLIKTKQERSDWIRSAIAFRYEYDFYKKGFLTRLIQEHFSLCKHLLRQVGAALKLNESS